jgi:hypothetical protein
MLDRKMSVLPVVENLFQTIIYQWFDQNEMYPGNYKFESKI